jgi:hypothetical protein
MEVQMTQVKTTGRPIWMHRTLLVMEAGFALFFFSLVLMTASHDQFVSAWVFGAAMLGMVFDFSKHWHEKDSAIPGEFSFCIGHPWEKGKSSIKVYAYGSFVHHGSAEDAEKFRDFAQARTGEEKFIYKLVQMPNK